MFEIVLFFIIALLMKPFFAKEAEDWRAKFMYYGICVAFTPFLGIFIWKIIGGR